ncbi:predicted protein [Uncinocarpus reesii 1704]|uniref:Uncharacterized protein n=1 Tax=Uncinocarpus reesii (strain UAMH 1704) TaxID=336963 RepID=C4JZG3_UNCRE|nr:uncharacterized protein UREG_07564 [Uncinocarpus reesii 1704]EEP82699.1 predicted protein [Uncinocarpus reesii 1704]
MPPDQVSHVLQNLRRSVANSPAMLRQNPGVPLQAPLVDAAQMSHPAGSNLINDSNMRAAMGMPYNMGGMQPYPGLQGQQFPMQKPNQQPSNFPQPSDPRLSYMQQRAANIPMTETQVREMDRMPFPAAALNINPAIVQALPKTIKSWGQLKMWASKNPQALGEISMDKLAMLQRIHFSQLQIHARREAANRAIGQPGAMQAGMDPNSMRQAPFNLAGPQHIPQQYVGQTQLPPNVPMLRPITAADVQFARQKLGSQVEKLSDDALRVFLEKNRHKQFMAQAARNREASQAFAAQAANQAPPAQVSTPSQQPQHIPTTQAQPQAPQSAPIPGMSSVDTKPGPQNVANTPQSSIAKPSPKSLKRPVAGEAEIKTPASQHPQTPVVPPARGQPPQAGPQPTREQLAAMDPQQRAQWETQNKRGRIPKSVADEAWSRLPDNLKQIYADIVRKDDAVIPVAMTSDQKAAIAQQLRENTDMLCRMDALVQWVARVPGQENPLRLLLQMRMLLMKQFKGPDWTLADHFTIAPEYLNSSIMYIKKWFAEMISRVRSRQGQPKATGPQPLPGQPAPQKAPTPLNASNLQQLEQQEAALQKARMAQAVPAAPTTVKPPFPIGASSPQGVPRVYGPTNVTQDNLTLPPPKRRKPNQPASKTTTKPGQQPASAVQEEAPAVAEARKPQPVPNHTFKCPVRECQYFIKGFSSRAALDSHVNERHKPEEPINDPVEYAIESFRIGLGIDKIDKNSSDTKEGKAKASTALGAGKSQPSKTGTKGESMTPASQRVVKTSSMAAVKSISPASLQQKTSQMSITKELISVEPKRDSSKDDPRIIGTDAYMGSPVADPWEQSPTPLEAIRQTFGELAGQGLFDIGRDRVDELLISESFDAIRSKDTPLSMDASATTQTSRGSDVSKDDDTQGDKEDNWVPSDWMQLPEDPDAGLFLSNEWFNDNWKAMAVNDIEMGLEPPEDLVYSI